MAHNLGWIKVYRQIKENAIIWDKPEPFDSRSAWIDLVMMANHKDRDITINSSVITIRKGQTFTSVRKLSEKWHWSVNRVRRYLDVLNGAGMIHKDSTHGGTLLTIVNYTKFQGGENTDEYTNGHTNEHTHGTPSNTRSAHKQECKELYKNDKRNKEIIPAPPCEGGEWQ